jgi:uncharacterized protein YbcI
MSPLAGRRSVATMSKNHVPTSLVQDDENARYPNDELAQICGEVAGVFRRVWGRGPAKTTAHWAGPNMLVVLLATGHTDAEKTMRAAGHIQELLRGRQLLALIVEDDLKARVERILGRTVETTLSATRLDPDLSAEIFLLTPKSG